MNTSPHPRLIFVTGKGGVGKTSLALALTRFYQDQGHKVLYNCFDQIPDYETCKKLELSYLELNNHKSAETYICKKLGSQTLARWIMKTPFFSSLFNILPGFGMMIVLGNIIELLENDPELIIIVDSPSSGHALTMLEATHNFKEMFGKGKLVDDITRMHKTLYDSEQVKLIIVGLPTHMALQEGLELKKSINQLKFENVHIFLNDIYHLAEEIRQAQEFNEQLPNFLEVKIKGEKEVLESFSESISHSMPHITESSHLNLILHMSKNLQEMENSNS